MVSMAAVLVLLSATAASFISPMGITANPQTPQTVKSLQLVAGYNFISLPLNNYSFTASTLIDSIGQAAQSITRFEATSQSYVTYDKKLAEFGAPQENFQIKPNTGYIVYTSQASTLTIQGNLSTTRQIPLQKGYNLVGWTSETSPNATTAFVNPSKGAVQSVSDFNESSQQYITYDVALAGFGVDQPNLQVSQGQAYFVFSNSSYTLQYDDGTSPTPPNPTTTQTTTTTSTTTTGGLSWLHTEGRWIKDANGNTVLLAGVNCYIRMQNERAKFEAAKAAGAQAIRLALWKVDIEGIFTENDPNEDRTGIPAVDKALAWCRELGLQVILDQHYWGPYGGYKCVWPAPIEFWTSSALQQEWLNMWKLLVNRYKNDPTVVGIDLMNEPYMTKAYGTPPADVEGIWEGIAKNAITELKKINPNLLFIVEDWGSNDQWRDVAFLKQNNGVYQNHIYYDDMQTWTDWGKAYASGDLVKGKQLLAQWIDSKYMKYPNQGVPFWMGETGFLTGNPHWKEQMNDQMTLFAERSIGCSVFIYGTNPYIDSFDIVDHTKTGYQLTQIGQLVSAYLLSLP